MQLVESVKERGVITPATVRQKEDGRYELVSGHRRKRACELAGFETLRSEIVDLNRDEATILMVESNFQRSEILPSEKAFAYKMRLEAMKRQAGRPRKENVSPVGTNLRTDEQIAQETGDSRNQIHRYVRLTNLVPELLEFVDEGRIKMRPAVELSYLDEDCQRDVVDEIDLNDATPSHDQTIRMRKLFNEGNLTTEATVVKVNKPNMAQKGTVTVEKTGEVFSGVNVIRRIIRDCNDEQFLHSDEPDVLLPHFSCHSLRHTFTTRMCEAGVNIKVIQDALGHSDISTTLNIYADVTKEMKAAEFKGLDSYFVV